jgi:two-component system, cell cycle response regulator
MTTPSILVVEDNPDLNEILCRIVASDGYIPVPVFTGRGALDALRTRGPFDLVLLDIMLPDPGSPEGQAIDGLEVCRTVKSDAGLAGPLIFMVTVKDQPDDIMRGIDAGADDYITKPFNTTLLLAKIRAMLRIKNLHRELEAKNARLEEMAITDDLTGIPNHRYFMDKLDEELRRAKRYGTPFALLMLDLDDFKAINDTFGHRHGDTVLRETARAIGRGIRATDMLARYGGDEFVVLLPLTELTGARRVAEEILSRFVAPLVIDGEEHLIRISIGLVSCPAEGEVSADGLINLADGALYRAKQLGGNRVSDAGEKSS